MQAMQIYFKVKFQILQRSRRMKLENCSIIAMKNRGMMEMYQLTTTKIKNQQR